MTTRGPQCEPSTAAANLLVRRLGHGGHEAFKGHVHAFHAGRLHVLAFLAQDSIDFLPEW